MDDDFVTIFPGLGKQLSGIICALNDEISDITPAWTLKRTSGKIFLDIEWKFKLPSFPATRTENELANCVKQRPQLKQVECETPVSYKSRVSPTSATSSEKKRKKKSPSTRKRDKRRRESWLALKWGVSSGHKSPGDPVSQFVGTGASSSDSDTATDISPSVTEARKSLAPRVETPSNTRIGNFTPLSAPSPGNTRRRRLLPPTPPNTKKKVEFALPTHPGTEPVVRNQASLGCDSFQLPAGYVGSYNQDLAEMNDLDVAVDLCPSCRDSGIMARMFINPEGNRDCPRCENEYIVTLAVSPRK